MDYMIIKVKDETGKKCWDIVHDDINSYNQGIAELRVLNKKEQNHILINYQL